ncbi:arabinose transporter [Mitsuaria sp. GD03876]|uniref:arabinose transporter n=1 Tax=Mitsuaria sp. GD03876 TaxID=2975399 RepID=UPI002449F8B8|nr:arabinose transporter [Mitsuaria sp. GD03876]MDH0865392.1 arabinose transporter [Mitsuaria sp. GD03876]
MTRSIDATSGPSPGTSSGTSPGTSPGASPGQAGSTVFRTLLPLTLTVFIGFLTIGIQLPVLPLHVHRTLGMDELVVGLVIGSQFAAALLSRAWAGNFADLRGTHRAVRLGLALSASSGFVYLLSLAFLPSPSTSLWILVAGRLLLALGESLLVTGAIGWGIGLVGPQNAGKVMAWIGTAIYGAFAVGAPLGVALNASRGFVGIAAAILVIPVVAIGIVSRVAALPPLASRRTPFYSVLSAVSGPGLGLALCSVGFGVITAFIALLFASKRWGDSSMAFTAFGVAFIGARIFFSHLPDKIGGAKVALVCVVIEAVGLLMIWQADSAAMAYLGTAITAFGYSLAFPGFGVEAVRRAPPQARSLAMGAYVAFLDLSLGIVSPAAGALAKAYTVDAVYLAGAVAVALSALVAFALLVSKPQGAARG